MGNRPDRTVKVLLLLLVIGVWGLLLRPLFNAAPVRAQQAQQPDRANQPIEQEIIGSPSPPSPSMVVIGDGLYVAGDGYITHYNTNKGQSLSRGSSDKLPSRSITKAPQAAPGRNF